MEKELTFQTSLGSMMVSKLPFLWRSAVDLVNLQIKTNSKTIHFGFKYA
jgi:hypothetical protein